MSFHQGLGPGAGGGGGFGVLRVSYGQILYDRSDHPGGGLLSALCIDSVSFVLLQLLLHSCHYRNRQYQTGPQNSSIYLLPRMSETP